MRILVINAGSSSVKFSVFDTGPDAHPFKAAFERFTPQGCTLVTRHGGEAAPVERTTAPHTTAEDALKALPALLARLGVSAPDAVGHRVAHGGSAFTRATVVSKDVMDALVSCIPLAPLHNPLNILGIEVAAAAWPSLPQVAVFDTAFHSTMPHRAHTYAVPKEWRDLGLRRYGFHGTSHRYVALRVAQELKTPVEDLRLISCHMGNGASVCAIERGLSRDTSMGLTALEGLVMGTRSGDVDPGLYGFLQHELGLSVADIEDALYTKSGLLGLAGAADMRDIEARAAQGDTDAQLAIQVYAYRVRKYIGAYAAAMGGVDVIAFTGGIGENSASMRKRICDQFEFLGLYFDEERNAAVALKGYEAPAIHAENSRVKVLVTQTREQWMIAQEVRTLLGVAAPAPVSWQSRFGLAVRHLMGVEAHKPRHIPVAISARHMHPTQETVEKLFGAGYRLTKKHDLSQPGQWAAQETVDLIGPKGVLDQVRLLGPCRGKNQIEISKTDTFVLGVDAPIRASGKTEGTPSIRVRGPKGEVLTDGLILAERHIHMSTADAKELGVVDGGYVDVKVGTDGRRVVFGHVRVRVSPDYKTEMHVDTDEGNAAHLSPLDQAELTYNPTEGVAELTHSHAFDLPAPKGATPWN